MVVSDAGNWCLIESDPGVFTDLINKFGKSLTTGFILSIDNNETCVRKQCWGMSRNCLSLFMYHLFHLLLFAFRR